MKAAKMIILVTVLLGFVYLTGCSSTMQVPHSYSSQEAMAHPKLFADGIISTEQFQEFGGVFTSDGKTFYFNRFDPLGEPFMTIYQTKYIDGKWSDPERLTFSFDKINITVDSISPDGNKMLLTMNRDIEGNKSTDYNIWIAEKSGEDWGKLQFAETLNTESNEINAIWTNKSVYFISDRDGNFSVYTAEVHNGQFGKPYKVADSINSIDSLVTGDVYVDSNETIMLMTKGDLKSNPLNSDIYVSYNEKGIWTPAEKINDFQINTRLIEERPFISPDGNYIFFTRQSSRGSDIYQIDRSAFHLKQ